MKVRDTLDTINYDSVYFDNKYDSKNLLGDKRPFTTCSLHSMSIVYLLSTWTNLLCYTCIQCRRLYARYLFSSQWQRLPVVMYNQSAFKNQYTDVLTCCHSELLDR